LLAYGLEKADGQLAANIEMGSFQELCQIRKEIRRIGIVVITALQEEELFRLGRGLE
jgi:hypothetical protein